MMHRQSLSHAVPQGFKSPDNLQVKIYPFATPERQCAHQELKTDH
jgi:hypothetical protein